MGLFTPPETSYTNYYEQARFNLTWKLNAFMLLVNLVLIVTMYFISFEEFIAAIYGWLVPAIYLLILYRTRKYKVLAIIYVILGVVSTGLALNFIEVKFHLIEILFMIMISLYAYFTLGKRAGNLSIIIQAGFIILYFYTGLNNDLVKTEPMTAVELMSTSFNFCVAFVLIAYLILQFFNLNHLAEERYVQSNRKLGEYNELVEARDAEKTVMLKEIHHRVKNNLQIITSLLRLQSAETVNDESALMFEDAIERVRAMSLIHEKMYQTKDLAALDFSDYLNSLTKDLIESYAITKPVNIKVSANPVEISNEYFVPLALLCNELVSNSLKHAFITSDAGEIEVILKDEPNGNITFIYKDNGRWKDGEGNSTFGVELIETLVEQLDGVMSKESNENGTTYQFDLKNIS